jgi:hypothetical protein
VNELTPFQNSTLQGETMPELTYLSALLTVLRTRPVADAERPRDAGDIVQYVVITAALAIAAVAVVAIIVAKITGKAQNLRTE